MSVGQALEYAHLIGRAGPAAKQREPKPMALVQLTRKLAVVGWIPVGFGQRGVMSRLSCLVGGLCGVPHFALSIPIWRRPAHRGWLGSLKMGLSDDGVGLGAEQFPRVLPPEVLCDRLWFSVPSPSTLRF